MRAVVWLSLTLAVAACGPHVDYTPGRLAAAMCAPNASVPIGDNELSHDDCVDDSDCGSADVCVCGSPSNVCAPAGCHTDADCADGAGCVDVTLAACGGPAVECQSTEDECRTSDDCPIVAESRTSSCLYDPSAGHTVCEQVSCPG